jgi:hypothetical protein
MVNYLHWQIISRMPAAVDKLLLNPLNIEAAFASRARY